MSVQFYDAPVNIKNTLPKRFERKYYIGPDEVGLAYGLLRQTCLEDSEYYSERINSLYFDTNSLDQHERSSSGDFAKDKIRIRWYGEEADLSGLETIYIELKSREGFAGMKQRFRTSVPADNLKLNNLTAGIVPRTLLMEVLAKFGYFLPEMLIPIVKISYWRYRFQEMMTGQRVSLDCHIRSTMMIPGAGNGEKELELPGAVIEIKGPTMELPVPLRKARMLHTDWTRFSKYSACIDAHQEQLGEVGRLSPSGRVVRL